ncbi:hypothetical protein ABH944_006556 [Caballeronia udeis]|uniref:Uncharacterized protein n=1 Tax=Caballeronia udeis TaxID=1232866 RepID=A0ABW8MX34_9BURK
MTKTASAPVTSHERYAHTTGYVVQRIAGPMSETVLEAAINVSPIPAVVQGPT